MKKLLIDIVPLLIGSGFFYYLTRTDFGLFDLLMGVSLGYGLMHLVRRLEKRIVTKILESRKPQHTENI